MSPTAPPTLRVEVHLREQDLRAFQRDLLLRKNRVQLVWSYVVYIAVVLLGVALFQLAQGKELPSSPRDGIKWVVAATGAAVVYFLLVARRINANARYLFRSKKGDGLLDLAVEISVDGLREKERGRDSLVAWWRIQEVLVERETALIYLSAVEAVIVPRSAFFDEAAFEGFVAGVKTRVSEARANPGGPTTAISKREPG